MHCSLLCLGTLNLTLILDGGIHGSAFSGPRKTRDGMLLNKIEIEMEWEFSGLVYSMREVKCFQAEDNFSLVLL